MASNPIVVKGPWYLGSYGIIVHGGAGAWRLKEALERVARPITEAVTKGVNMLLEKDSPLEGVVEAIAVLENSGVFNAGIGSTLSYEGKIEMDAGVMSGDYKAGAVAIVTYPKNPIKLAKYIAQNLDHVIIGGQPADKLARRIGLEKHPGPSKYAIQRWELVKKELEEGKGPRWAQKIKELYSDTVGAAAFRETRFAAGASTGGITLKHSGRIGDSPIPGAGFYAEDEVGACSATGIGETIILTRPCAQIVQLLSNGYNIVDAVEEVLKHHTRVFGSDNLGIIAIDKEGNAVAGINTRIMPVGVYGREYKPSFIIVSREG